MAKGITALLYAVSVLIVLPGISGWRKTLAPEDGPKVPPAFRSVLDNKPRMLTLKLDSVHFASYDLANCSLYKVWIGGIDLQGTVYNSRKEVAPASWGTAYFVNSSAASPWITLRAGNRVTNLARNRGYELRNGQVTLHHLLVLPSGDTIGVTETPVLEWDAEHNPVFTRNFAATNVPPDVEVFCLAGEKTIRIGANTVTSYPEAYPGHPMPSAPVPPPPSGPKGKAMIESSDCMICHELAEAAVGPSFRQVANRYRNTEDNIRFLTRKVKSGGTGSWGDGIMNPHPQLSDPEILEMLKYIFTLRDNTAPVDSSETAARPPENKRPASPGFGAPLEGVHPSYDLTTLHTDSFQPKVGGLKFMPDGRLVVTTWDPTGGVYLTDPNGKASPKLIASGLAEPLGIEVVDGEIFVLQKQELTQLIDHDGDEIIDEYRAVCNTWQVCSDFHEFAFGLVYKDGFFYAALSMAMRLNPGENQLADRGRVIRIARDGSYEWVCSGLRTPNGIGLGIDGELFVTDNQGQWLPGNKLIHVKKGAYYGMAWGLLGSPVSEQETPPAVWLPQNEIGNSPTEPVVIGDGPYRGQMLHGDMMHGGIKRDFLEKVDGQYQGAVFRFSQGFEAGVNRLAWGPDGALYVGQVGMKGGGWSWKDRLFGLQKIAYNGKTTFEMLAVRAKPNGFEIEFTEPLRHDGEALLRDILIQQWYYRATASYGGPKRGSETLSPAKISISSDRTKIFLDIAGLKKEHVVYFRLPDTLKSISDRKLWSSEAWYTLNQIPDNP